MNGFQKSGISGYIMAVVFALVVCCHLRSSMAETPDRTFPSDVTREQTVGTAVSGIEALEMEAAMIQKSAVHGEPQIIQANSARTASAKNFRFLLFAASALCGLAALRLLMPKIGFLFDRRENSWIGPTMAPNSPAEAESFSKFVQEFEHRVARTPSEQQPKPSPVVPATFKDAIADVRATFSRMGRTTDEAARQELLCEMNHRTDALKQTLRSPDSLLCWEIVSVLEGLLKQMASKAANVTPSALRTVASALDLLNSLGSTEQKPDLKNPPVRVLAVDDNAVCRYLVSFALQKVVGSPDLAHDGEAALALADKLSYDLFFVDVEMPGMDGFELCSRIRTAATNESSPIVFITRHSDFETRAKSSLTGARDFISKPFLTFEVALKALTLIIQRRMALTRSATVPVAAKPNALVPLPASPLATPA